MCMELLINGNTLPIQLMATPAQKSLGMMGRKNLNGGMLFIFPDVQEQSFWMKNCLIPLDIIMLVNDEVTKIHDNCHPCKTKVCQTYTGIGDKVLELNGGDSKKLGIKVGDKLEFI